MKKLILFLAVAFLATGVFAQTQITPTVFLRSGHSVVDDAVSATTADTANMTLTNTTAKYWYIKAEPSWYSAQEVVVTLDSASGDHTNVAVQLQGKLIDFDTWANIGSAINWAGTTSDTTIVYSNTTENKYREFRVLYTGTGTGTTLIIRQFFKMYNGLP